MTKSARSWTFALALLAGCSAPTGKPAAAPAPMPTLPREGAVVFLGDSITWDNHYLAFLQGHLRRRHPDWNTQLVNRAARGETVGTARTRLERDVLPLEPRLVLVLLGMNDGGQRRLDRGRLVGFREQLAGLVADLRRGTRADIVLATPTAVAPADAPYNRMLAAMAAEVTALGRREGVAVIDLHHPLRRALAEDPEGLMLDPLHPGPAGHLLIADLLARQLHPCRPAPEATTRIDLSGRKPIGVNVAVPGYNVHVPAEARPALKRLPSRRRAALLGEQRLVLTGLEKPVTLKVGPCCHKAGRVVTLGTFTPDQLARGISLDHPGTPWVEQAARLHRLLQQRWRMQRVLASPESSEATTRAEAERLLARVEQELFSMSGGPQRYWVELSSP